MTPPPRARSVTPAPTVPPPELDDAPAGQLVRRLEPWKWIGGSLGALVAIGFAAGLYKASLATKDELEQVRAGAAAQAAAAAAGPNTQLQVMQVQQQGLAERMAGIEGQLSVLSKDIDRLLDQATEIARATGARRVPATRKGTTP